MASNRVNGLGMLFQEVVNGLSHRRGKVTNLMNKLSVTLPQILVLNHLESGGRSSPSGVAQRMRMSLSSTSQMVNRLAQQGLVMRVEDPSDRRKKVLRVTKRANSLLRQIREARTEEYSEGISRLPKEIQLSLATLLPRVLESLRSPRENELGTD